MQNQVESALQYGLQAIKFDPAAVDGHFLTALCYLLLGKFDNAQNSLLSALQVSEGGKAAPGWDSEKAPLLVAKEDGSLQASADCGRLKRQLPSDARSRISTLDSNATGWATLQAVSEAPSSDTSQSTMSDQTTESPVGSSTSAYSLSYAEELTDLLSKKESCVNFMNVVMESLKCQPE